MSLVRLLDRKGMAVFIDPSAVAQISQSIVNGCSVVMLRRAPEAALTVKGTPDEVHTALFPKTVISPTKEQQDRLLVELRAQAQSGMESGSFSFVPVDMRETATAFRSELEEALNPATYEAEWGPYTPEQTRAMQHALTLVRARLGVG